MTPKGRRILYEATADSIRAQIASGKLSPGELVGSSLGTLAAEHHVGIGTMRAALRLLSDEGLVETIAGKGTFVLAAPANGTPAAQDDVAAVRADVAAVRADLGRVEAALIELYGKTNHDYPARKHPRSQDPREERRERAG